MTGDLPDNGSCRPLCPVFGQCGGCQYQNVPYAEELTIKQKNLEALFQEHGLKAQAIDKIVPSPAEYHYRCRLDMKLLKTRDGRVFMGFSPAQGKWMIEVESCPIAMSAISEFLPQLKKEAIAKLTPKYRNANLVVKTGDDGRVFWGGIGRRSLNLDEKDYLWTDVCGKRIFYSLDGFFQANLSILPRVIERIRDLNILDKKSVFYDLYGGVGLFGICLSGDVGKIILIEENIYATGLAAFNKNYHSLRDFDIIPGRVENVYPSLLENPEQVNSIAFIDPPRQGMSPSVAQTMAGARSVRHLLYLSCDPESLIRDLKIFTAEGWTIARVMPFDFFPKTRHLETLVLLRT